MKKTNLDKPLTPQEKEELLMLIKKVQMMEEEITAINQERAKRLAKWEEERQAKRRKRTHNKHKEIA